METGTDLSTLAGPTIPLRDSELDVELGVLGDLSPEGANTYHHRSAKLVGNMGSSQVKGEPEGATMSDSSSERSPSRVPYKSLAVCTCTHLASAVRS